MMDSPQNSFIPQFKETTLKIIENEPPVQPSGLFSYIPSRCDSWDQSGQIIQHDVKIIKESLVKKKKQKGHKLPLRDPLTHDMFTVLLNTSTQKRERILPFSRCRVALALVRSTGWRVNESRLPRKTDMEKRLTEKKLAIYQPTRHESRDVFLSHHALTVCHSLGREIECVFKTHEFLGGTWSPANWMTFMNARLHNNLQKGSCNMKSHSFRVNEVTQIWRKIPLHDARKILGHKDRSHCWMIVMKRVESVNKSFMTFRI